jgi:hypothetical protein
MHRVPHFVVFLSSALTIKSIKNYPSKGCSALVPKMLVKLTPGPELLKHYEFVKFGFYSKLVCSEKQKFVEATVFVKTKFC